MEIQRQDTTRPSILVIGDDARGWVAEALGDDADLTTVSGAEAAREHVEHADVDCAVVAPHGAATGDRTDADTQLSDHETAIDLIASLRSADPDLPIVYAPADPDGVAASEATAAGATEYFPRSLSGDGAAGDDAPAADVDGLADRVERAVEAVDRDRQRSMEQAMLRSLLSTAPLSIYFKDRAGRHVAVTSHTTGSFDQTFVGKTDLELYADEIGEELARESYEDDLAVVETGEPVVDREERHVTPEGVELWLRTTKFPWRDADGEIVGLIGLTRDVTEVKQRERELEAEKRRLEQFASFASHDLRNPVGIAQGYLERAMTDGDEAALQIVDESLQRMEELIDDLLNIARSDGEGPEIDGWADLHAVAERAWAVGGHEDATLELAVPEGTEIYAAEGALRQLLENVLSNAVEHGSTGDPSRTRTDEDGQDDVAVSVELGLTETGFYVADDGPGIPADHHEDVFEYGYTTSGTGVGLAITREIAESHGWTPRATESEAGGARFEFGGVIRRPPPLTEVPPSEPVALETTTDVDGATPPGEAIQDTVGASSDEPTLADEHRSSSPGSHARQDATALEDAEGAWTLRGGGENLWGELDAFFALHGTATGDCRIEARITDLETVHEYSKAGVLVAEAVESDALLGFAGITASHGAETAWRTAPDALVETDQFDAVERAPVYLRLDRVGDRCTAWASADGEKWTPIDQAVLPLASPVAVGLAVCSHNPERRCEAVFEEVRVVSLDRQSG